ncbi:hypothetical protein T4D_9252, partial [Trichinella pseudospiralis]
LELAEEPFLASLHGALKYTGPPSLSQLECVHPFDMPLHVQKNGKPSFAVWAPKVFLLTATQTAFLSPLHQIIRVIFFHMPGLVTVHTLYSSKHVTNHTTDDHTAIAQRRQQQQRQHSFPCTVPDRENQVQQDRRPYRNIKRLYIWAVVSECESGCWHQTICTNSICFLAPSATFEKVVDDILPVRQISQSFSMSHSHISIPFTNCSLVNFLTASISLCPMLQIVALSSTCTAYESILEIHRTVTEDSALVTSLLHFDTKAPLFITSNNVVKNLSLCPQIAWCRVRQRYGSACSFSFALDTFGTQAHRFAPNTLSEGDGQRYKKKLVKSILAQLGTSARMRRAHEVQLALLEVGKPSLCSSLKNSAFSVHTTNASSSFVGFETFIDSRKKRV